MTALSRILGLVRDIIMASYFATTVHMSAFVIAFTLPNLFRRLFGEGALSAAFVPIFVELREKRGAARAWHFASQVTRYLAIALLIITAIALLIFQLASSDRLPEKWQIAASLAQIMMPYMIFICLAALCMGMLNSLHRFALPAFAPSILNLVWIGTALFLFPLAGQDDDLRIRMLAWAVLVAGLLQWLVQMPLLRQLGFRFKSPAAEPDPQVKRMVHLMLPAALGAAITQLNVLTDRFLAMGVNDYAASALYYSERLIYLPLGLFGTAIGTVLLPVISGYSARNETERITRTVHMTLRMLGLVMIPAAIALGVLATPIIEAIFAYGRFDATSVSATSIALRFYAPGLLVFSLAKAFIPVLYAHKDTRTPVHAGIASVLTNLTLNVLFILTWPADMRHAGLACATVIAEAVYVCILGVKIHQQYGSCQWQRLGMAYLRFTAAAVTMSVMALWTLVRVEALLFGHFPEKTVKIIAVNGAVLVGILLYGLIIFLFRYPEAQEVRVALQKRRARRTLR